MYDKKSHSEWLSLIEVSGPFLAETVLDTHFPQGLDELEPRKKKMLRQAYDEWREAQDLFDPQFPELHTAWIELVLKQGLELDEDNDADVLKPVSLLPESIKLELPEHGLTIKPDFAVITVEGSNPSLLIQTFTAGTDLEAVSKGDGWSASPVERMVQLCRASKSRMGLLTNGERWVLIDAPEGGVTTFASWYARLWGQEPTTLQAFINLLGIRRFFLDESQQLPALFDESLKHQDEVTDALGDQVRRAVEVLVQALDKADLDRDRDLLKEVQPTELYEAGLTVMMRLVFLLSAEERGLLLLGEERYEAYYAVSTLRMQLREQAGLHSEEILSHRRDAWSRLLAIFRAVYGGIEHETLRMPALGGSLFDPDRFPFLEGRAKGSNWRYDAAQPLPIDNRTVLLLLDAIQLFKGRTLSYRALDVEQIGYVYEGLLERTVVRAKDITLELKAGKSVKKPWMTWGELEDARLSGKQKIQALFEERSGSKAVKSRLDKPVSDTEKEKLLTACQGDQNLRDRLAPYYHFLKIDSWGYPLIYPKDAFMVATGSDRRETGTHYTPKSLTESIVKETLEPVVYIGPAEGKEKQDWQLKTPAELLDLKICDLAMGSGAFLVQVCRYLSERLLEAWAKAETEGKAVTANGIVVDSLTDQEPLTADTDERSVSARRLISERCLYGVDVNPLAVELAKLSIWLITLAKGRPFGFLDHNLKHGDSLLGITDLEQLYYLDMNPTKISEGGGISKQLFAQKIEAAVKEVVELRLELRQRPILDIHDVEVMSHLDGQAREKLEFPELVADSLVAEVVKAGGYRANVSQLSIEVGKIFEGDFGSLSSLSREAKSKINSDLPYGKQCRKPFHWCLEFPEIFTSANIGFDAIIGNPPFVGGQKITGSFGTAYRNYLVELIASGTKGSADLVAYFFLQVHSLLKPRGCFGLLAVNTIAEGDTRQVGLEKILENHSTIFSAYPNEPWPGQASVITSRIHLFKGEWHGRRTLSGEYVSIISAFLSDREDWTPAKLESNKGQSFQGSITLGLGFNITEEQANLLIDQDPKNSDVLFPYLNGKDLNTHPEQKASRWVINFWDWPLEKAREYKRPFSIVEEYVRPEREGKTDKSSREKWWLYLRPRAELYHSIGRGALFTRHTKKWDQDLPKYESVLCNARVGKYFSPSLVSNDFVFHEKLVVMLMQGRHWQAFMNASLIVEWIWNYSSRMKMDLNFSPSDAFETLPLPNSDKLEATLSGIGSAAFELRSDFMDENSIGLTGFNNRFHSESCNEPKIIDFRELISKIDNLVLGLYGWSDIELNSGFHKRSYLPDNDQVRFTISEKAREEVLYRLAILNKERYQTEVNFSKKKKSKPAKAKKEIDISQPDLFGG